MSNEAILLFGFLTLIVVAVAVYFDWARRRDFEYIVRAFMRDERNFDTLESRAESVVEALPDTLEPFARKAIGIIVDVASNHTMTSADDFSLDTREEVRQYIEALLDGKYGNFPGDDWGDLEYKSEKQRIAE